MKPSDDDAPKDPHKASRHLTGADWVCGNCGNKNASFATVCTGCGSLASDAKVQRPDHLMGAMGLPSAKPATDGGAPAKSRSCCLPLFLLIIAALGAAVFLYHSGKLNEYVPAKYDQYVPEQIKFLRPVRDVAPETSGAPAKK